MPLAALGQALLAGTLASVACGLGVLPLVLISAAAMAATLAPPVGWPLAAGLGGTAGDLVVAAIARAAEAVGLSLWPYALTVAFAAIAACDSR